MDALDISPARTRGRHIFADVLARYAAQTNDARLVAVERRVRAAVRVAVTGRQGVGRSRVAAALAGPGLLVTSDLEAADVQVLVLAETLKPEDEQVLRSSAMPTMVVLNKADLAGADSGGPLADAERSAARLSAVLGLPVTPMIAVLADVVLGDEEMAALRILTASPADMDSTDAFVRSAHRLPPATRSRLLASLDRFGLAHAILAVADGAGGEAVSARLRELSQLDRVSVRLAATAAPLRYRRVGRAVKELRLLAARDCDERLAEFLCSDEVVLAVMAAAVDVVQACGGSVDRTDAPEAHLRRAVRWHRYAQGPVSLTHQRCAADIVRGSLRLLERSR